MSAHSLTSQFHNARPSEATQWDKLMICFRTQEVLIQWGYLKKENCVNRVLDLLWQDKEEEEAPELPENSPMFVPTKGKFFQHDDRILPGEEEEEQEEQWVELARPHNQA